MLKKGYIQVYTGNGKGKTTAALGLALREAGRGLRTYIGQFMKGQPSGELKALEAFDGQVAMEQYGRSAPVHLSAKPDAEDISLAQQGLDRAAEAMCSGQYDIIVLDEVTLALRFGLLTVETLVDLISLKPEAVELVITGRYAPKQIIERADLVTEMQEVKHYYQNGVGAREGIEQ